MYRRVVDAAAPDDWTTLETDRVEVDRLCRASAKTRQRREHDDDLEADGSAD